VVGKLSEKSVGKVSASGCDTFGCLTNDNIIIEEHELQLFQPAEQGIELALR